jgi:hypothetical protein
VKDHPERASAAQLVRLARVLGRLQRDAEREQTVQLGPCEVPRAQEIPPGE